MVMHNISAAAGSWEEQGGGAGRSREEQLAAS